MAANHFTPEEKLLAEHCVGLCSRPQALSPTITEPLYRGAGRFPGAVCVTAAALPARRAAAGAAPRAVAVRGAVSRAAFPWFPRGAEQAAAPGAYSFSV